MNNQGPEKQPATWAGICLVPGHRLYLNPRLAKEDQGVCEGAGSERLRSVPVSLSVVTGLLLLFPVLIGTVTWGPPRFHAVGPNPTDVDQFNFIVLLLSLVQILNTKEAEHSLPSDKVTLMRTICMISGHNRIMG